MPFFSQLKIWACYFSVIPDIFYRESILSFVNAQQWLKAGKSPCSFSNDNVQPILYNIVQATFRVAGSRPDCRGPFVSAKGPKTISARHNTSNDAWPNGRQPNSLRSNKGCHKPKRLRVLLVVPKAPSKWRVSFLLKKLPGRIPIANPCNRMGYSVTFFSHGKTMRRLFLPYP